MGSGARSGTLVRYGRFLLPLVVVLVLPGLACELDTPPKGQGTAGSAETKAPAESIAQGREAIKANQIKEAREILTKIIEKDPSNAQAFMLRGIANMREGKLYAAVQDLSGAAQIAPSADIYFNLGNALQQGGFYDRAAVAYRAALELSPDDPEILNNLASALLYMRRTGEAQQALMRVTQMRPDDPEGYTNLGISYERDKAYDEAERYFFRALEVDPDYWPAVFNLAKLYELMKQDELAAEHYARYLKIRPDAPDKIKIQSKVWSLGGADAM